jgi:magnesium transporter
MITDWAVYERGKRRDGIPLDQAHEAGSQPDSFVWIGLHHPTLAEFDSIRTEFDLHELAVEDALAPHQRPKLEVYGDMLFVVLRTARYVDPDEVIEFGQIMLFVGEHYVITVRHGQGTPLGEVRRGLERNPELLRLGPGAVLHGILDRVVDDYQPVLEGVDNDIRESEQAVFDPGRAAPVERIYKLKREVLEFHRAAAPLVDPVTRLVRASYPQIHPDAREYFRDVQDHLLRYVDEVNEFNSLLTSMLDANLTQVTLQQNADMRRITAWAAIIAVPTAIAGIYGMNFTHMPELNWVFGYPMVLIAMAVICGLVYRAFRRSGWL